MLSRSKYDPDYERFRVKLRLAREDAHLTQEDVAPLLGKPQSFVSKIESGERRLDFVELQALARIYQRSIGHFQDEGLE